MAWFIKNFLCYKNFISKFLKDVLAYSLYYELGLIYYWILVRLFGDKVTKSYGLLGMLCIARCVFLLDNPWQFHYQLIIASYAAIYLLIGYFTLLWANRLLS